MRKDFILNGNRILAEFEFRSDIDEWGNMRDWLKEERYLLGLKYHTDWDRLMEVVLELRHVFTVDVTDWFKPNIPMTHEYMYKRAVSFLRYKIKSLKKQYRETNNIRNYTK